MDQQTHTQIRIVLEKNSVKTVESSFEEHCFYRLRPSRTGLAAYTSALNIGAAHRRMDNKDLPPKPDYYIDEGGHIIVQWNHENGMMQFAQALSGVQVKGSVEIDGHRIRIDGQSGGDFLLSELSKALLRGSYERLADINQVHTQICELLVSSGQPHPVFKFALKDEEVVGPLEGGTISDVDGFVHVMTDDGSRKIDMRDVVSVSLVNSSQK